MRRFSKSSEMFSIFWWHGFQKSASTSPFCMRKRVEKSEAILALLDGFQELHLDW